MIKIKLTNQSKKTGLNRIWSSLTGIPRNPSTSETTRNDPNNPLPTPTDFDLDGCTTPNDPNKVIIKEDDDKKPTTTDYELL